MAREPQEKYTSALGYRTTQLQRWWVRSLIRRRVSWSPLREPRDGYTLLIGCNAPLARMLGCNLRFLEQQDREHLDRILVVIDTPRESLEDDVEPALLERFATLPIEFLYYSPRQRRVCDTIGWPWVQSWMCWSIALAQVRTRFAMLHDFDAMLLRPDIIEERYRAILERGDQYVGMRHYHGGGVADEDGLVTTFELMFDAAFVRERFRPIDLFNHVTRFRGRRVDFDTFLWAQSRGGTKSVLPIPEEDLVHPSQLICQFEDLRLGRRAIPSSNNLPLVPYFLFAGGEPDVLREVTPALEASPVMPFFGNTVDVSVMRPEHLRWIVKQARRLEVASVGAVRDDVARYIAAIEQYSDAGADDELAAANVASS